MPRLGDPLRVKEIYGIKERPSGSFEVKMAMDWVGWQAKPFDVTVTIPAFFMAFLWKAYDERRKREDL
jgi:hypothetical protein